MKETLVDLNSFLFEELERVSNPDLSDEELKTELSRLNGISLIAKNIINNADLLLRAQKFSDERYDAQQTLPKLLGNGE